MSVLHTHDGTVPTPDSGDFNALHWNINRLKNKLHHVDSRIAAFPGTLHAIAISETFFDQGDCSTCNISNYSSFHFVREVCGGGGISLFVHNSVSTPPPIVKAKITTPDLNHFFVVEIPSVRVTRPWRLRTDDH